MQHELPESPEEIANLITELTENDRLTQELGEEVGGVTDFPLGTHDGKWCFDFFSLS